MNDITNQELTQYLHRYEQILEQMQYSMFSYMPKNSITINFIECMIPHHQAAIDMCKNLLTDTNFLPLQNIANDIIQNQEKGISNMEEILKTTKYYNLKNDIQRYYQQYVIITKNMINRMKNTTLYDNINMNFMNQMIPHHNGAISMCQNVLQYPIDPRLKTVAESIILEQENGIKEFNQIVNNLFA